MVADGIYGLLLYRHQQNLGHKLYGQESITSGNTYRFVQSYRENEYRDQEKLSIKDILPGYFQYAGSRARFEIRRANGKTLEETLVYDDLNGFRNEDGSESKRVLLPGDTVTIRRLPDICNSI